MAKIARSPACKICGNEKQNILHPVREMMFGLREEFQYLECSLCGCLQIKDAPGDMTKYYPDKYYSFEFSEIIKKNMNVNFIKRYLRYKRTQYAINQKGLVGKLASTIKPIGRPLSDYLEWLKRCSVNLRSKILDVGCGKGQLLLELRCHGFKNLTGVDPYIKNDIIYNNGVRIFKKEISALDGRYDMLIFNHSFEHMPNPLDIFAHILRLLEETGHALIRMPTTSSYAWRRYGTNWVQIDAPRHLFLHSLRSIEMIALKTGLKIKEMIFDSTEFQFWGSEQYAKDISLLDERSYYINPGKSIFGFKDIESFRRKALELNRERLGDQLCIYLIKE